MKQPRHLKVYCPVKIDIFWDYWRDLQSFTMSNESKLKLLIFIFLRRTKSLMRVKKTILARENFGRKKCLIFLEALGCAGLQD